MLDAFLTWVDPGVAVRLLLDVGYMVRDVVRGVAQGWHVVGEAAGRLAVVQEDSPKVRMSFGTDLKLSAAEVLVVGGEPDEEDF